MAINSNFQIKNGITVGTGGTILVSSGASIGIGTTNPTQILHVVGNSRVTGSRYDSNNLPGTIGQILTSTGSGTSWFTQSTLTVGNYLTGGSYNGSSPITIGIAATSANTANNIVARDASGNFSAGTITANLVGSATTLATPRNINGVAFNGSSDITITASTPNNLALNTSGIGLSGSATFNGSTAQSFTVTSNATSSNSASTLVSRDASGNFSAGTITANLVGTASTASQVSNSLTLNTSGIGLSGSATFNGGVASTFTVTSNATSSNSASTLVSRDASGNFSAGTITANLVGTATTSTNLSGGTVSATTGSFSGIVSVSAGSSVAPAINFSTGTSTGIFFPGSNQIAFTTNGTEDLRILSNGNIGIGTTNPTQTLHVVGSARVTGAYYDSNNTAGSSGQFLTSTGSSTTWQTIPVPTAAVATTDLTMINNGTYFINSTSPITLTLPATPPVGTNVLILNTTKITHVIARNGSTIEGLSEDLNFDAGFEARIWYDGTTWQLF